MIQWIKCNILDLHAGWVNDGGLSICPRCGRENPFSKGMKPLPAQIKSPWDHTWKSLKCPSCGNNGEGLVLNGQAMMECMTARISTDGVRNCRVHFYYPEPADA